MIENKALSKNARDQFVVSAVIVISAITLLAVLAVLISSGIGAYILAHLSQRIEEGTAKRFSTYAATGLGVTIATTGLSATLVCLLLRLRDHDNDLVTPPALTGPIVVVAIGAALALGVSIFAG